MQITLTGASRPIPLSFLGVSVETRETSAYIREKASFDRALSLLRSTAGATLVMRVGGASADDAVWNTPVVHMPSWVFEIGSGWLEQLAALTRRDRLRVSLTLNLAIHSPAMEAALARTALRTLGRPRLAGFAIGNEPDLFRFQPGLEHESAALATATVTRGWTKGYSPSSYRRDYLAYARALQSVAPGVPVAGPEVTQPTPAWLHALAGLGRLSLTRLTVHRYPMSMCWPRIPAYSQIAALLGERSSAGLARRMGGAVAAAHQMGLSLTVSEMNDISCGGRHGVTDSFATALWAPDALFELLRAGVDSVDWHFRARMANSPFELTAGGIKPLPELYGLVLFTQMMGPNERLIDTRASQDEHVKVWAVRSPKQTKVLLINKGPHAAMISIRARAAGDPARLERLWAPSVASRNGITLAGRSIGRDGRWHGQDRTTAVGPVGGYRLVLPGFSAALLQMPHG